MTQCIHESCANVNPMQTLSNSYPHNDTSYYVQSYHDLNANPNANPKNECDYHEMSHDQ